MLKVVVTLFSFSMKESLKIGLNSKGMVVKTSDNKETTQSSGCGRGKGRRSRKNRGGNENVQRDSMLHVTGVL